MLVTCGRCILYVVYIVHFGAPSKLSLDSGFLHVTFAGCCSFYSLCRCLHCKHNTKTWYFIRQFRTNERTNARRIIIPLLFVNLCCLEINLKSKFIHLYPHFVVFVHYFHFLYNRKFLPTKTYWQERERESVTKSLEQIEIIISCSYIIITTMHAIFFRRNVLRKEPTIERIFRTLLKISVTMENLQKVTK